MNKTIKWILLTVVFAALLAGVWLLYQKLGSEYKPDALFPVEGESTTAVTAGGETGSEGETTAPAENGEEDKQPAFDFTVYDYDGNAVKLSDFFGKPIVLNFWASWCSPCKAEMPDFEEIYREHGEQIQFLMVNMTDGRQETVASAQDFIDGQGYTFPVYFDKDTDAATAYYVTGIPMTVFIDKDGYMEAYAMSMLDKETLLKGIAMISDVGQSED
ncbi:MAG: TlpA family protein disulfide reductase [Ruminococcaceae bacterium]|nr:TlpA family protein disulfide reductase [Oscillospiraceae bacterium]